MTETKRHRTIVNFWPHYLGAHRNSSDRALHFLGTSALGLAVVGSVALEPARMLAALGLSVGLAALGTWGVEPHRPAWGVVGAIIALTVIACPHLMIPGIALGYVFALVGHRLFERNLPTSARYPLWSMLCDLRLFATMATGRLWWGDAGASAPSLGAR